MTDMSVGRCPDCGSYYDQGHWSSCPECDPAADDDAALLHELAVLRDRCTATLAAIGEIQLRLARRAADLAETQRLESQFGPETRTILDP